MASLSRWTSAPSPADDCPIAPHHYQPPTPRELRAQAIHRLQIGVLGLASMLLLVGLANIIMDQARVSKQAINGTATPTAAPLAPASATPRGDPLADIGVVPDMPASEQPQGAPPPVLPPVPPVAGVPDMPGDAPAPAATVR